MANMEIPEIDTKYVSPDVSTLDRGSRLWLLLAARAAWLQHVALLTEKAQRRFCKVSSFPHLVVDGEESSDVEVPLNHAVRPAAEKLVHYCLSLRAEGYKCPHQESDYLSFKQRFATISQSRSSMA